MHFSLVGFFTFYIPIYTIGEENLKFDLIKIIPSRKCIPRIPVWSFPLVFRSWSIAKVT